MNTDVVKRRIMKSVKEAFAEYQEEENVKTKFGDSDQDGANLLQSQLNHDN